MWPFPETPRHGADPWKSLKPRSALLSLSKPTLQPLHETPGVDVLTSNVKPIRFGIHWVFNPLLNVGS